MPAQSSSPKKSAAKRPAPKKRPTPEDRVFLHVDVNVDTPRIRQQRQEEKRRAGFRSAAWLIVLFCGIAFGHVVWRHTLYQHPRFALKEAIIKTEGQLTAQKLARAMGLSLGMDTLWLNLRQTAEKAKSLPQVQDVSIRRDYEGHLFIDVVQRRPIAWLECPELGLHPMNTGHSCLLDAEGIAMPCEVVLKEYTILPVIAISTLDAPQMGTPIRTHQIQSAVQLVLAMQQRSADGLPSLQRIIIEKPYQLKTIFATPTKENPEQVMTVVFSPDQLDTHLPRFDRVMLEAHHQQWQIASLNLLPRHNVPVTFR
jgi:hypothetical protein